MDFTKDKEYYEQLDKRTKEYKEWKAWHEKQSEGLGDTIEKVTKATGVKTLVEKATKAFGYEDCGCDKRKEKLNNFQLFRYRKPKCLELDEFIWLSEFFAASRTRVTIPEQNRMYEIYNRVFDENKTPTSCASCYRNVSREMKKVVNAHKG